MVMLLSNLPQFLRHKENNSWPKWIKKKSYYKSCFLFCELYSESLTGDQADLQLAPLKSGHRKSTEKPSRSGGRSSRKRGYNPAFSSKKKGIFGLKK
jgi:poly(A) polymerase